VIPGEEKAEINVSFRSTQQRVEEKRGKDEPGAEYSLMEVISNSSVVIEARV